MPIHQASRKARLGRIGIVLIGGLIVLGCAPQTRDRLRRFFFEIPEEPTSPQADAVSPEPLLPQPVAPPGARFVSLHPPFVQRQCSNCHDPEARMSPRKDILDACRECHPRYFTPETGHAPVKQGQCSECHDPHRTVEKSLLKKQILETCTACHDEPTLLSPASHSRENVGQCTTCHDPHFGTGKLLRNQPGGSGK